MSALYEYRRFGDTYVISLMNHVEVSEALTAFFNETGLTGASIIGIGAVNTATLRMFDPATKKYVDRTFDEQMEIANLTGNLSTKDGKPYVHLHIVLGREDYTALAGHLLTAVINGAGEITVTAHGEVGRYYNEEIGLNLYKF